MPRTVDPLFFSCDWGTTNFRLALLEWETLSVLAECQTSDGVKATGLGKTAEERASAFRSILLREAQRLCAQNSVPPGSLPVVISGMASSTIGWREVPYAQAPVPLSPEALPKQTIPLPSNEWVSRVILIGGLRAERDVMRGEESQIVGFFTEPARSKLKEHCCCLLPGTHSKHVVIEKGAIQAFRTHMTGELLELLSRHSILRDSVELGAGDAEAFREGVRLSQKLPISHALFQIRTGQILLGKSKAEGGSCLLGLLLGCELASLPTYAASRPCVLLGKKELLCSYLEAFQILGCDNELIGVEEVELARGLFRLHAALIAES